MCTPASPGVLGPGVELNSAGGDIRLWDEVRKGFGVWGDFGLFRMVAYRDPSTGPCVWDEAEER